MRGPLGFVVLATLAGVLVLGAFAGLGFAPAHLAAMAVVWLVIAFLVGRSAATERDSWLPRLMVLGMVAKLAGAGMRLFVLEVIYGGSGDAGLYHGHGTSIAETWRTLNIPDISSVGYGSDGTRFITWLTGLFYAPYEPSMLGGFWIFAFLAFVGQFFFYLAFRVAVPGRHLRKYALAILLWPTFLYWPSSIGKEAVIMLFLGVGSWAAAHLYKTYQLRWLLPIGGAVAGIYLVRVHVAALFVGAMLLAAAVARRQPGVSVGSRRIIIATIGLLAVPVLATGVGDKFDFDGGSFAIHELDPVLEDVGETTEQGGSAVSGGVIRSPVDVPAGTLKVLFRPLPHEAGNIQMLAASLEGLFLLLFILWRLPAMLSNLSRVRGSPYMTFAAIYTAMFVWAWSAILNLGILARQRSLVLPFVLALVVGLGWDTEEEPDEGAHDDRTGPVPVVAGSANA